MARQIQPGDYVEVSLGTDIKLYRISFIQEDEIYIHPPENPQAISIIVVTPDGLQILGSTEPYRLTFRQPEDIDPIPAPSQAPTLALTGLVDADILILNMLDDQSLQSACRTSAYITNICRDDRLWKSRIIQYFGNDALQFKVPVMSWKDHYILTKIIITDPSGIYSVIGNGCLDILQWLAKRQPPILPDKKGINQAARYGRLDIFQWMAQLKPPIHPTEFDFILAARNGHLDILQWIDQQQLPVLSESTLESAADGAAKYGYLDILQWLAQQQPSILPSRGGATYAAAYDHPHISQWMAQQQPPILPEVPNIDLVNIYVLKNEVKVLEWMSRQQPPILPTIKMANSAIEYKNIETLNWMAQKHIFPDVNGANYAAKYRHDNILDWLAKLGIYPTNN